MIAVFEFLAANAALLVALLALGVSLRANFTAHLAHKLNLLKKADSERLLLFEKKRELLNEVDQQNTRFAMYMMLAAQKMLLFKEHPSLHDSLQGEYERLSLNLECVRTLSAQYEEQRRDLESIDAGFDIAALDQRLANIRRLTIQFEKNNLIEQAHLNELRSRVGAPCGT